MENNLNQEKRSNKRYKVSMTTLVKGPESNGSFWYEPADLTNVSQNGGNFCLHRNCPIGGLISLTLPMPRLLRSYDFDSESYTVWAIVQHCTYVSSENFIGYYIGVAFIGKYPPKSFKENPFASYRISGLDENGLWKIFKSETAFVVRKHQRFNFKLIVKLKLFDYDGNIVEEINAYTINISENGAAIVLNVNVMNAYQIIFICQEFDFHTFVIVRHQQKYDESNYKLHLEFVENKFPTKKLFFSH